MVTIIFEAHATTFDNENSVSSGWQDVRLSPAGMDQARELGQRYADQEFAAIFCSDLKRSIQTVNLAFDYGTQRVFIDWRLRECDYGELTGAPKSQVDTEKAQHIDVPFTDGESYAQCADRIASFLADVKTRWDGKKVLVVGHRATQYGLEHWINNKPLDKCVTEAWSWQPGWTYQLN